MWRYRNAAHYIAGILVSMSYMLSWILPLVGFIAFITYELNEDWHLHDRAYRDILELMIGFFGAVTGLIIWRLTYG